MWVHTSRFTILPNVNTLQCILNVVGAKLKVCFDVPNSLASVLGFNRSTYDVGRHASEQIVNIMSINSILVLSTISSQMPLWSEDTRSTKQFKSPGNCIRHFNTVSVANGPTRKAAGSSWRGIDYTFSSS